MLVPQTCSLGPSQCTYFEQSEVWLHTSGKATDFNPHTPHVRLIASSTCVASAIRVSSNFGVPTFQFGLHTEYLQRPPTLIPISDLSLAVMAFARGRYLSQ